MNVEISKTGERGENQLGKVINYFAGGNTAKGFYSLFDSNIEDLNHLYILKGGPGTGKSTMMKWIGKYWEDQGLDVEYIHCASDNDSIDGVIIREISAGIVDGTHPHIIEPKFPGLTGHYVNLLEAVDSKKLWKHKDEIQTLTKEISNSYKKVYEVFSQGLKEHDELEKFYIQSIKKDKAEQLTQKVIDNFFGNSVLNKIPIVRHRFLGAATPKGPVDFIQNLTEHIEKRYFIKGRPGSGKSTMLKRLAKSAEERGFDVEIYHCGFDPNSLDMVIIPEKGIAIFDSTAPHEHFPTRDSDEVIDLYELIIEPGTDEKFAEGIQKAREKYSAKMLEGTSCLAETKKLRNKLENIYIQATDFSVIEKIRNHLLKKFIELA